MSRQTVPLTSMIRVPGDMARKLSWLARLSPFQERVGDIVVRLIEDRVDDAFERIRDRVEQIEALEADKHAELGGEG
jgi:hypothetical protein